MTLYPPLLWNFRFRWAFSFWRWWWWRRWCPTSKDVFRCHVSRWVRRRQHLRDHYCATTDPLRDKCIFHSKKGIHSKYCWQNTTQVFCTYMLWGVIQGTWYMHCIAKFREILFYNSIILRYAGLLLALTVFEYWQQIEHFYTTLRSVKHPLYLSNQTMVITILD